MKVSYSKYDMTAGEALGKAKAVYISGSNEVKLAKADQDTTIPCVGFTDKAVAQGETVRICTNDTLDVYSDLIPGATYYLSQTTAGEITATKPTTGKIISVGVAKTTTEMDIHIDRTDDVFGSEIAYGESETLSSTTSITYVQKLRISLASIPAGIYRIAWAYQWASASDNVAMQSQVQIDDDTIIHDPSLMVAKEYSDSPNDAPSESGFKHIALTSGNHTIDLDYKSSLAGTAVYISKARIEVWRVG